MSIGVSVCNGVLDQLHALKIGWKFTYYFVMVMIVLLVVTVVLPHLDQWKVQEVRREFVYIFTPMLKMYQVVSKADMCSKLPNL